MNSDPVRKWRHRAAAIYFASQGGGVIAWWLLIWLMPTSRPWFRTSRMSDSALLDFAWPDLTLVGTGSILCAFLLVRDPENPWSQRLVWLVFDATLYATLYVAGATFTTGEGWVAAAAMLAASQGSFLAVWTLRLDGGLCRVAPHR